MTKIERYNKACKEFVEKIDKLNLSKMVRGNLVFMLMAQRQLEFNTNESTKWDGEENIYFKE